MHGLGTSMYKALANLSGDVSGFLMRTSASMAKMRMVGRSQISLSNKVERVSDMWVTK